MLRELNTQVLIDLGISAHQYIIAMLLLNEHFDHLNEYLNSTNTYKSFDEDLKNLSARTLVRYNPSDIYNYRTITVLPTFMREVAKYDGFEELYNTYPKSVVRPDGKSDYLRRDKRFCKQIYSIVVKDNRDVHEHIMSCLHKELNYRKKNGRAMSYMKRLNKWLSDREWENFEDELHDNSNSGEVYGTTIE